MSNILTIGSDPELNLYNPVIQNFVSAENLLVDLDRNKPFGLDGCPYTAELRPEPSQDPLEHAKNIKNLLFKYKDEYKDLYKLEFYSSNPNQSIGGHIHLGNDQLIKKDSRAETIGYMSATGMIPSPIDSALLEFISDNNLAGSSMERVYSSYITSIRDSGEIENYYAIESQAIRTKDSKIKNLVTVLDDFVAFPLMFIENSEHAKYRKQHYGKLSDFRQKDFGIEYRTPPSWLASERLTQGVLTLAYSTAYDYLFNNLKLKNPITSMNGFDDIFTQHYTDILKPFLHKSYHEVKHLTLYPKYKPYIDYIFYNAFRSRELLNTEIKQGWKIPYTVMRNITLYTVKELIDKMTRIISINQNEDRQTLLRANSYNFVVNNSQDYMIPQVTRNINQCLTSILKQKQDNKTIYIYGRKKEAGDVINIEYSEPIDYRKIIRLKTLIRSLAREFKFTGELDITTSQRYISNSIDCDLNVVAKIGLARSIREQKTYLSEAIILVCLLYFNTNIYKSYSIDKRTGKKTIYPLFNRTILKLIKNNLASEVKKLPKPTPDIESEDSE